MNNKLLAELLVGLVVIGASEPVGAVPIQWSSLAGGNDHWYELVSSSSSQITWTNAEAAAQASSFMGAFGHLASITSNEENLWVHSNIVQTTSAWIGGYQAVAGDQGSWAWSTGDAWVFTAWAAGQPDNFLGGVQHTLYYQPIDGPKWDDAPDHWSSIPSAYVVEYQISSIPEPTTISLLGAGMACLILMRSRLGLSSVRRRLG
jgi:hypothetical protein